MSLPAFTNSFNPLRSDRLRRADRLRPERSRDPRHRRAGRGPGEIIDPEFSGVLDTEVDIAPWRSIRELMAAIVADLQNNLDRGWQ